MRLPNEDEYAQMLGRLQDVMAFAAEELEQLANGVKPGLPTPLPRMSVHGSGALARGVMFRIGNDVDNPVPTDLPTIAETPTPDVPS